MAGITSKNQMVFKESLVIDKNNNNTKDKMIKTKSESGFINGMKVEFSDTHPTKSFPIYRNYNNLNESVLQ
jgi:hypothetical protein